MKISLLLNRTAGGGRAVRQAHRATAILRESGATVSLVETRSPEHLAAEAEAAASDPLDALGVVGGDGTIHTVVNGLLRAPAVTRPPMGVVPCGRGNDFARTIGITDLSIACAALLGGARRRVDLGRTESGVFLGVAGAGFDSQVARRAQQGTAFLSGAGAYVYAVIRTLAAFEPVTARVRYQDGHYEGPLMFAAVGNTGRYGGGMRIAPLASIEDGLLDLCLVKEVSRTTLLRMLPRVFSGGHLDHPQVFYVKTPWVEIDSKASMEVFADGEFMQRVPVRIEVLPAALEVLVF
ncbi:MAG: diacylglycerol/lipid kinase family protein [Vicinamibacteria bacterium]